jgi:hypothetical protein
MANQFSGTPRERFDQKWTPEPFSGCHLWTACGAAGQYGRIGKRLAHRVSWEFKHGPIPSGIKVLHKCDVPPCVNPDHLFLGTQRENIRDCIGKGRFKSNCGVNNPRAILTPEQVLLIRNSSDPGKILAKRFGIGQTAVSRIKRGKAWECLA